MSTLLTAVTSKYEDIIQHADPRVSSWWLMSSPGPTLCCTAAYLAFVGLVPRLRLPPLDLRPALVLYNAAMALLSAYMFKELVIPTLRLGYSFVCQPVSRDGADELRIAAALWCYFASKLLEFLDTVFFVLRGRGRQVTFLHVYHHASMLCVWWVGVRFFPGGSSVLGPLLNCAVHVLMYSYYGLTAAFPNRHFWWKRHLTLLQLVQFSIVITASLANIARDCGFPSAPAKFLVVYMLSFMVLFLNFYVRAYSDKGKENRTCAESSKSLKNE